MEASDLEGLALSLYRRFKVDPTDPVSPIWFAREWLGKDSIVRGHAIGATASVGQLNGRTRIMIRPTVPREYVGFVIGHELGHLLIAEEGCESEDEEADADRIAGALMAPLPAMRRLYRAHGLDLRALAGAVVSTQTWAALRVGEAIGTPIAVVSPADVRVRGPESFVWPAKDELRRLARTRKLGPGLAKARITDAKGRAALVGDEDVG